MLHVNSFLCETCTFDFLLMKLVLFMRRKINETAKNHEDKNQDATSFTNKYQDTTSSESRISFTMRKINVQVSRREKLIRKKFCEQNQHKMFHEQKPAHKDLY